MALTRYDHDPEALAWARGHVQKVADRYREFERHQMADGDAEKAAMWRKFANLLEFEFIGGRGCVIRPFDERAPEMYALLADNQPDG